jgi:CubicO group peptidase (beta-lactamase class C family)
MEKKLAVVLMLSCSLTLLRAQVADSLVNKVDAVFSAYDKTNSPGCALAILKDGSIIYKRGYGMSNLEYHIAITPSSIFHVASVSKQFAAAAIVRLSLEGRLSLDDDIRKYVPEVPDFGHVITVNHLLHHSSGLRDQWDLQWLAGWRDDDVITENDVMEMLGRQKGLNFLPGDEFSYCNTGYTLLGVAVKKITGVSLRDYADSVFFKPLGMANTHFHSDHAEVTPNRTSAYRPGEKGTWKISIPVFDNYGATSLFTTVEDLAKWDENFYSGKIGGKDFLNAMQATGVLNDKTPQTYASGLIRSVYKGYNTVEHSGADAGYRSNFLRFPGQHFSVILLANLANIDTRALTYKVADLFLQAPAAKEDPAVKIDTLLVRGWAGDYFDRKSKSTLAFSYGDGSLRVEDIVLKSLGDAVFREAVSGATFVFSGDSIRSTVIFSMPGSGKKHLEKIKKIKLAPGQLGEYKGEFFSRELDTKYKLFVKDSVLQAKIPRRDELKFSPLTRDVFSGDVTLSFSRNKSKKINGFFLSTGRTRNLYFEKLK